MRQWVTYAESHCGPNATKALNDCHAPGLTYCTALQYLDANLIYAQGSVPIAPSAQESWWLHQPGYTDAAHRLLFPGYGGGNLLDQANPAVDAWFQDHVRTNYNSYDGLMMDDTAGSLNEQLYGSGFTSSNEITSDSGLLAAHQQMAAAVTHADGSPFLQVNNGVNANPSLPFPRLNNPSTVNGLVAEGAPLGNGTLTYYYPTLLDYMSYVDQTPNDFMVLLSYDPSGSLTSRRVQAATALLGYSAGHIVSWSNLEQNSGNLAIWPEEGIVPTAPLQSMATPGGAGCMDATGIVCATGGHNDLQVADGVYRREFGACYNQGVAFGPCAVIMNTTGSPVTVQQSWLAQSYQHQITMNGGDVQSGGMVNLAGADFIAGTTAVGAQDAMIIASSS